MATLPGMGWDSVAYGAPVQGERRLTLAWVGLPMLILGIVLMALSGPLAFATAGESLTEPFTSPITRTPVDAVMPLHAGRYAVYELTGGTGVADVPRSGEEPPTTIHASQVSVTSSGASPGRSLTVREQTAPRESIGRDTEMFTSAVSFEVPQEGEYRVTVRSDHPVRVMIAPLLGSNLLRPLGVGAALVTVGFLLFVTGVGLVIAGLVMRRPGPVPLVAGTWPVQLPPMTPPPGWYPDPASAAHWRWWDGRAWGPPTAGGPQR